MLLHAVPREGTHALTALEQFAGFARYLRLCVESRDTRAAAERLPITDFRVVEYDDLDEGPKQQPGPELRLNLFSRASQIGLRVSQGVSRDFLGV